MWRTYSNPDPNGWDMICGDALIWGDVLFPFGGNLDNLMLVWIKMHQPVRFLMLRLGNVSLEFSCVGFCDDGHVQ
jgi:hypothetical protein